MSYTLKKKWGRQRVHPYSSLISSLGLSQQVGARHYPDLANLRVIIKEKNKQQIMCEGGMLACRVRKREEAC